MTRSQISTRILQVVDSLRTFRADAHGGRRNPYVPQERYLAGPRHLLSEGRPGSARKALQDTLQGLRAVESERRETCHA